VPALLLFVFMLYLFINKYFV